MQIFKDPVLIHFDSKGITRKCLNTRPLTKWDFEKKCEWCDEHCSSSHTHFYDKEGLGSTEYIYTSKKGTISLLFFPNIYGDGRTKWVLYGFENPKLKFKGKKEFFSMKGAEKKVKELLEI